MSSDTRADDLVDGVAIIGMAGRFPGARSVAEFWRNQLDGVESISHFRVEDLDVPNAAELAADPNYVRSRSILDEVDLFDAEFFGIYPREAVLMDPQHRLFLECCWQCFEDAGYDPYSYQGPIGVYAGVSMGTYFLTRLCTDPAFIRKFAGGYQVANYPEMMGNSPDFLSTRVAYKLNLRGPSFTMQSGCSTSLVAVTQACQALLTYQADMALAGGSSITFPQKRGSFYQEGGMVSPDGHCRTFDAAAQGTVFGSGVAVVLLKRLDEAVRDGDQIYAVIRGFAVNNDGSAKVGYTAPGIEGQSRVIALAHRAAGVDPETIGYIEAHGTATPLGDPIELAALTRAFRSHTAKKEFCTIGTAKTNVGHLDIAAGVTGLIHAAHIVRHGVFPPTLHFHAPNAKLELDQSPFRVNKTRSEWRANGRRRAGVSAFGVGGTNAHVVLEEAPQQLDLPSSVSPHVLVLSARSPAALDRAADGLAAFLQADPKVNLADAAWTLQVGRRAFDCRRAVIAGTTAEAISMLQRPDRGRVRTRSRALDNAEVCFLFPGQGSQHPNMAREVYDAQPVFRAAIDQCAAILEPHLKLDLRTLLYPSPEGSDHARARISETILAQPAIFAVEYALAQLWISWGIRPQAMIGHSVGEFVAACLAGVFSLKDALALVATRGRMMQELPRGGMLSVRLPEAQLRQHLDGALSLAAINAESLCVVAGPFDALESLERRLVQAGIACRRLATSHAFHSSMMDPLIEPFTAVVSQTRLATPKIPYVSGVTGKWITESEAVDPSYWARHFRQPVLFSAAVSEIRRNPQAVLLEVGPGTALTTLARQHSGFSAEQAIIPSLSDQHSGAGDALSLAVALADLWVAGPRLDWPAVWKGERRRRISLPTYPFERKRYWLETAQQETKGEISAVSPAENLELPAPETAPSSVEEQTPMNVSIPAPTDAAASRESRIRAQLAEIFEDLSGMDLSQMQAGSTFLEMGFDSLFLTQVTQALQTKFRLKITLRQLLGDESTLEALAAYVNGKLPADASPAPVDVAPPPSAASGVGSGPTTPPAMAGSGILAGAAAPAQGSVERLMREQLQAMNELFARQLDALRALPPNSGSAIAEPPKAPAEAKPVQASTQASPATEAPSKPFGPYKPPEKSGTGELTEIQARQLSDLVERYCARTPNSKELIQKYRRPLADPRVVSGFRAQWKEMVYPLVTARSKGSRLWDIDGNEYIDVVNGFGPIMLGHRPPFVEAAIEKQLREGFEIGPQSPLAGEVAELFCQMTGNERMTFCNTGSEAVIAALRVARTVTGRNKVVFFSGDYHGMFDEVLVKGVKNRSGLVQAVPIAPGIPRENVSNMIVLDYGTPEALDWIRGNLNDLAAILVEPVQSRHPDLQPIEFLKELRVLTEPADVALIFDEVVTGFRVHPGGCQALFGIRADLATYGKVIAGGMPIGILAGKSRFMDALDGGAWQFGDASVPEVGVTFFAGTFVRHPLTLAAAKAVLQHLKERGPSLQEELTARTARLVRALNEHLALCDVSARVETFGSIFYVNFSPDERLAGLFFYHMRLRGVHIREGFPCFLTTEHSDADIDFLVRVFKESIAEMLRSGFLSGSRQARSDINDGQLPAEAAAPMTEPQREIFLASMLGDDASRSFNESFSLRLRGPLQIDDLRRAVNRLLDRHEALRATIDPDGESLHFSPELRIDIPLRDLSTLDIKQREAELAQILRKDADATFDLGNGPLVRAQLVRLDTEYHILVFTSHHIVCDGWSTNVLLSDLAQLYSAAVQGRKAELSTPVRFSEYSRSLAAYNGSPESTKVEAFWLAQFAEIPPLLELPLDYPRTTVRNYAGATVRHRIGAEAYQTIKQLGSKRGCTLFATLLAGFYALLSRLSHLDDIVVGIPAAGQSLLDDGNLVGHCVNFLPLRVRLPRHFADLLGEVKKRLLDAYDHQSYTYGSLVRKLSIARDPSRLPLMEVQFNLERIGSDLEFHALRADVDPNPKTSVNFDIFFNIVESNEGLMIDCDFNTGLFDSSTIERWMRHYETLLLNAASNPTAELGDLTLMSAGEVAALVGQWNPQAATSLECGSIHEKFEQQAARSPGSVAVQLGDRSLTYRDLNTRANKLARALRGGGVRPGSLVAVSFERSPEMIVAFLAILKAGAAYLPIDSSYPTSRLAAMFEEAHPAALLTQESLAEKLSCYSGPTICVDRDRIAIDREDGSDLRLAISPGDTAYVMYTSGSTGKPKGVMISHHNVVRLLTTTRRWFDFGETDVWTLFHSYAFDFSTWEIWGCLTTGGRLEIVPYWVSRSPREFFDLLAEKGVTVLNQTPAAFYNLIQVEASGYSRPLTLRYVIFGGEQLNFSMLRPWIERHGDSEPQLVNMYGITETTVHVTYRRITADDARSSTRSLIGAPIPDLRLYLLDEGLRPVPPGVVGELYVGGAGVAKGYLNRPDLTSERFLPDPFSSDPGGQMYKSGDLARFLDRGDFEYLGRADSQVKIHGFRIELGEIEAALAEHPDVAQAAAAVSTDKTGQKKLFACFVAAPGRHVANAELRTFLESRLPAHMVPQGLVAIDALPLTSNGKIDRQRLSVPEPSTEDRPYVKPTTPQERILADIMADVLKVDRVGATDNLFELGADSLHVFQITSRAADAGLAITPRHVLQHRTIAAILAAAADAGTGPKPSLGGIRRVERKKYRVTQ